MIFVDSKVCRIFRMVIIIKTENQPYKKPKKHIGKGSKLLKNRKKMKF